MYNDLEMSYCPFMQYMYMAPRMMCSPDMRCEMPNPYLDNYMNFRSEDNFEAADRSNPISKVKENIKENIKENVKKPSNENVKKPSNENITVTPKVSPQVSKGKITLDSIEIDIILRKIQAEDPVVIKNLVKAGVPHNIALEFIRKIIYFTLLHRTY